MVRVRVYTSYDHYCLDTLSSRLQIKKGKNFVIYNLKKYLSLYVKIYV